MWYHYKWMIILIALFILFVGVSAVQLLRKEDPDATMMFVGPWCLSQTDISNLTASAETVIDDYDGNGETVADIFEIVLNQVSYTNESGVTDSVLYDYMNTSLQRFQVEIRTGDCVIYFLERSFYDLCVDEGILAELDDVLDDADMPDSIIDKYGIYLSDLDIYTLDGFNRMPEDTIVCMRRLAYDNEIDGPDEETWEYSKRAFVSFVTYTAPATDASQEPSETH